MRCRTGHEGEERPEELAARREVHAGVVPLSPDERGGVYGMVLREALLDEMASQVLDLL